MGSVAIFCAYNIIANADQIAKAESTDHGKPAIQFIKNINGKNAVVEYVSDKRRMLYTQTMWINKKILPLRKVYKPLPLRPKRLVVRI